MLIYNRDKAFVRWFKEFYNKFRILRIERDVNRGGSLSYSHCHLDNIGVFGFGKCCYYNGWLFEWENRGARKVRKHLDKLYGC